MWLPVRPRRSTFRPPMCQNRRPSPLRSPPPRRRPRALCRTGRSLHRSRRSSMFRSPRHSRRRRFLRTSRCVAHFGDRQWRLCKRGRRTGHVRRGGSAATRRGGGRPRDEHKSRARWCVRQSREHHPGTLIPAVLESALDSTRAGFARAIVSRDVRGFDGTQVLILEAAASLANMVPTPAQAKSARSLPGPASSAPMASPSRSSRRLPTRWVARAFEQR